MKINSIQINDLKRDWKLEQTRFKDLTLLVGISGVGKTNILKNLHKLKRIAQGNEVSSDKNGLEWELEFETSNKTYLWNGKFEYLANIKDEKHVLSTTHELTKNDDEIVRLIREKLIIKNTNSNSEVIFERDNDIIIFQGKEMPKLSPFKSLISILSHEDILTPIVKNFNKNFHFIDLEVESNITVVERKKTEKKTKKQPSLDEIRNLPDPIVGKLLMIYKNHPIYFKQIQNDFTDTFPQVESIRFHKYLDEDATHVYELQIKEQNTHWISQNDLSSGMKRSLFYIALIHLVADESVILIDEIETSLGVNCIDIITEDLCLDDRRIQYIFTSHHPYIINNVPTFNWKIVTRKGSYVKTIDAENINILNKSKHEAFKILLNLDEYLEGVE